MKNVAIEQLEKIPELIEALMEGVTEDQALSKRVPGDYSLAELLEYLSHIEGHYFRARLDGLAVKYEAEKYFASGAYSNRDPEESFAHWQEQRDDNLHYLDDLPRAELVTTLPLVNEWAAHDLNALARVAQCISGLLYGQ